ncbi:MAG: Xaa-Pro peptidase family protein [Armatimonadota bacterium]|nr:Xaa-Pro peptidase family protein [Armatimonadota bacterium]MDR5696156.1 Xaa-Pro peptidase family protein [Armatimonadota bacterium]
MVGNTALRARLSTAQAALAAEGLGALICQQPENLVMLAGYWPVIGRSALLLPADSEPVLLAPEMERDALARTFINDVRTFPVWKLGDPSPEESLARGLRDVIAARGLSGLTVGVEQDPDEDLTPTQKVLEPWYPALPTERLLSSLGIKPVDASALLRRLRARKTAAELQRLRVASEIAAFGIRAFYKAVDDGRSEAAIAAEVEHTILTRGVGYKGTLYARGQALVFSGAERLFRVGWGFAPPTERRLARGDFVMLELSTVADGYYSDLTRMATVGPPSARQLELLEAVRAAQQAALSAIRPGVTGHVVDRAARGVLDARGLGSSFLHITGHGLGFRYHEAVPLLAPGADDPLTEGMVTSVEPGVYAPEFGGVRIEDNVVVTATGAELLSS